MAKRKAATAMRGGGDIDQQIGTLEDLAGAAGVKRAEALVESEEPNVIKLAFRYIRRMERASGPQGLGQRIETLLSAMPESERNAIRVKLLQAKVETAKK